MLLSLPPARHAWRARMVLRRRRELQNTSPWAFAMSGPPGGVRPPGRPNRRAGGASTASGTCTPPSSADVERLGWARGQVRNARSAAKGSSGSRPARAAGDRNADPFLDLNARRMLRPAGGGRQPVPAACHPPCIGTPAAQSLARSADAGQNRPGQIALHRIVNFAGVCLARQLVQINAVRASGFLQRI